MLVYDCIIHEENSSTHSLVLFTKGHNPSKSRNVPKIMRNKAQRKPKLDDICHNCGKKRHQSLRCLKSKKSKHIGNASITIGNTCHCDNKAEKVFMATNKDLPIGSLLNSMATCHMIANHFYFDDYYIVSNQNISIEEHNKLLVAGIKFIIFWTIVSEESNNIYLLNILHISNLKANLISLGILQHAGVIIKGLFFELYLLWNDKDFLHANLVRSHSTLYCVECLNMSCLNNQLMFIASESTMRLQHRQLGHINPCIIKFMLESKFSQQTGNQNIC